MSKCEITFDGVKIWRNDNGDLHRDDGPAIEYPDGSVCWYLNNIRHRENGPASEYSDGIKFWHYKGKQIKCASNEEFLRIINMKNFW